MMTMKFSLPLVLAFAAALSATPADAQKGGNGNGRGQGQEQRDRDRDDDDRYDRDDDRDERHARDRRDEPRFERRGERRVPPGWCQGRGNPHNTAANCRYNSRSSTWERLDSRTGRYETRDQYERRTRDSRYGGTSGSYEEAHREFHYSHDRQCRERASQRPLDIRWQVQVRGECKAAHDEFHRRWGTAHR
ncbi:MAG TPA: hypothetical protein VGB24_23940 [Longimicrobium sp.]|jgi:Ni/Co efflux regulator RcnB|uniref:hypothetical protein n=1 Tax=Longimicrobium sp. TaxID=2029185 RepID=UPI002EDA80A9